MMSLDVSKPFGKSLERAAAGVKAKVLIVVSRQDYVVTPGPATDFARLLNADLLVLESDGHLATVCEHDRVARAVSESLAR